MKGELIAEKSYLTHPNHAPADILKNVGTDSVEQFIEDYKKAYSKKVWETIGLVKDCQKFEWEVDINFTHNADEVMLAHIMEEEVYPYYGFNISIKQYVKIGKRCGRTKKKGKVNYLVAKMRNLERSRVKRSRES